MNRNSHDPVPGGAGEPAGAVGPALVPSTTGAPRWAWGLLALVFAMHALVAADLWLMEAVLPRVGLELRLDEEQTGWLPSVLLLGAAASGPAVGYFADRLSRPRLLAVGFAAWSLAVVATGLARSESPIQAARAAAGAGGAAATVIALTLLADAFPRRMRGRAFAAFFLAIPAGALLGRWLAYFVPPVAGWPAAFLIAGGPGLALAMLALALPDPVRGASEPVDEPRLRRHEQLGPSREDYIDLMVNSSFNYSVFGMAFSAFAVAGLTYWFPSSLAARGLAPGQAADVSATVLLAGAVAGLLAGGWLADAFAATRPGRLFLFPAVAMLAATAGIVAATYGRSPAAIEGGLFLAAAALWPIVPVGFTVLAGVTMPNMRGVGFGVALAAGHVLGDLWSPSLLGWVIDTFAQPDLMATGFGRLLAAIGAVPVARPGGDPENLIAGLLAIIPALLIAGAVLLAGIRHLPRELALMVAKLRATPTRRR